MKIIQFSKKTKGVSLGKIALVQVQDQHIKYYIKVHSKGPISTNPTNMKPVNII